MTATVDTNDLAVAVGPDAGQRGWWAVCALDAITPDRGVAALVDGSAVAVFVLGDGSIHAIDNVDPISGASVLSRGLVGDIDGRATVASPMYKQRFDLTTGRCIDSPDALLDVHEVCVAAGIVWVRTCRPA
jgi:nitrite reductase (NADH) small subunit